MATTVKPTPLEAWAQSESTKGKRSWIDLHPDAKADIIAYLDKRRAGETSRSFNELARYLHDQYGYPYSGAALNLWVQRNV